MGMKEEIEKLCSESFDRGAKSYKESLVEALKKALGEIPDISGNQLLDMIEKIDT